MVTAGQGRRFVTTEQERLARDLLARTRDAATSGPIEHQAGTQ